MLDRKSEQSPAADHPSIDLMSELLLGMRLNGVEYRRIEITPPFGISFGAEKGRAQFHFMAQGSVLLRDGDGNCHVMNCGDAILMPRGGVHDIVSGPSLQSRDIGDFDMSCLCANVSALTQRTEKACSSNDIVIFSASMEFDLGTMQPLASLMPERLLAGTLSERYPEIVPILEAMEREAMDERAGFAGILARLADAVAVLIVRAWIECGCGDASGWVEALRDPRLGRVIAAIHRNPGHNWSLAEMAAEMGASRSVFAERFHSVTGTTPLRYLTEVRMRLAAQWIGREGLNAETAAHRLGYGSLSAFSRAYKRVIGVPPGATRASGRLRLASN